MTSKLAKSQIELWQKEGLKPTVDDIVLLNNLGIAIERGSDMFSFAACPRIAFLGDCILREPTVAKRIWIDEAQRLFANTFETKIYVTAYALGTADNELPSLYSKKKIEDAVKKFRDEVIMPCTSTQILAAIDYVLIGNKPDLELPEDATDEQKEEVDNLAKVYKVPVEDQSMAKQLLMQAFASQIPAEAAGYALLDDLERMVLVAAMHNGADILKNEHTQAAGKFYVAAGRIHERLVKEKEEKKA